MAVKVASLIFESLPTADFGLDGFGETQSLSKVTLNSSQGIQKQDSLAAIRAPSIQISTYVGAEKVCLYLSLSLSLSLFTCVCMYVCMHV